MVKLNKYLLVISLISLASADLTTNRDEILAFGVATEGANLVYFLIIFFMVFNFATPVGYFLYERYLFKFAEQAAKDISKMSKRLSDRISDAKRRVSQSIRSK